MNNENNGKSAIVIVGGAFRSTYYSGGLQALEELGIGQNFDLYVGISAGAPTISYFLSGKINDMSNIWTEYIPTKKVYNPKNIFTKKPILDLDYLVDSVFSEKIQLNIDSLKDKNFLIPLMEYETGNIQYFKPDHKDFKDILKASMCIPWLTRKLYKVDNTKFIDAIIAENLIVKKLIDDGYSKILIMMARTGTNDLPNWKELIIKKLFLLSNTNIRKVFKKVLMKNIKIGIDSSNNSDYQIIKIFPTRYHLSKFENSKDKMQRNIDQGYKDIMENEGLKEKLLKLFGK